MLTVDDKKQKGARTEFHKPLCEQSVVCTRFLIMDILLIVLCCLVHHVASQTDDIFSARILAQQTTISQNSDLFLTCSTFGKKNTMVNVYLCKDDVVIDTKKQKEDINDTTFLLKKVGLNFSGNYSCVYSTRNDTLSRVTKRGRNTIQILVIANFLPADISVAGPSAVSDGNDVEFRCTLSTTLQTLGECQLIQSYLLRNDTIMQVQTFSVTKMEATFSIREAVMRDSGHYSCVVLPSKCIQEQEDMIYGNNAVVLEVTEGHMFQWAVSCGLITLVLVMVFCVYWINKQVRRVSWQLQEQDQDQDQDQDQEQEQGEGLESHDEVSFSMDDGQLYQNGMAAEGGDVSSYDDCDGLYSVVDDGPNGRRMAVYATSSRRTAKPCSSDLNFS